MPRNHHQEYLSKLPPDWKKVTLEQLGTIYSGGTPSRLVSSFWNGDIAWITPGELTDLEEKWIEQTNEYITKSGLSGSSAKLLPEKTLLFTSRATIGSVAITAIPIATNQGFKSIVPNQLTNPVFYCYLLQYIASEAIRLASGSTFDEISRRDFVDIVVPRPRVEEQHQIAQILDTIDETIAHTENLINKLKLIKTGLLHDLLTYGLDKNGELRSSTEYPEQFKDSPLGKIPQPWEVMSLNDACLNVIDCPHTTPIFRDQGILVARTSNIRNGVFDTSFASYVSSEEYRQRIARLEPQPGDIVFTREAPVGEAFVIPQEMKICLGQRTMLLRPNPLILDPGYVVAQIYSGVVRTRINQLVGGTTNPHLNVAEVRNFSIPIPSLQEQFQIFSVLDSHNARIYTEETYLSKLKLQKQGLMDDLLTGRVRVNSLEKLGA